MKKIYTLFLFCFSTVGTSAQLFVDTSYTVEQMMYDFFDTSGITISNVQFTGSKNAVGYFDAGNTNLGISAGIMITSGSIFNAVGPNIDGFSSTNNGAEGDADLTTLSMSVTFDASVIEFDLIPTEDTIIFKYVFGSEEYSEWVGSTFNDVFGFFVDGQNIALIPNTSVPVTINNVNCITGYTDYYVCNDPYNFSCPFNADCPTLPDSTTVEYDGFTTPLSALALVVPGQTYHIKIAVADASDYIYDSGVFLSISSLDGAGQLKLAGNFSTQINGNEVAFDEQVNYASSWLWDFGDGSTSVERNPVHTYADLANETYIVTLIASNFCCSDTITYSIGQATGVGSNVIQPLSITPNPVKDYLNVTIPEGKHGQLNIYDEIGTGIYENTIYGNSKVDFSNFPSGIYVVRIISDEKIYQSKVIRE
jgi:PKD repeat protein